MISISWVWNVRKTYKGMTHLAKDGNPDTITLCGIRVPCREWAEVKTGGQVTCRNCTKRAELTRYQENEAKRTRSMPKDGWLP